MSIKIVNFGTPLAKVLVIGHGHFSHIAKILSFSLKKIICVTAELRADILIICK